MSNAPCLKTGKWEAYYHWLNPVNIPNKIRKTDRFHCSPVTKLIERLLIPELNLNVNFQEHKHGYRKESSTTTALNCISFYKKAGLNQAKPFQRTLMVVLD